VPRSNLTIRIATSVVAVPSLLWLVFGCPAWAWYLLVAAAVVVGSRELFAMTHPSDPAAQGIGAATSLGVSLALYFFTTDARALLLVVLGVILLGTLVPLWRLGEIQTAGLRMMAGIAGPLYLGALLTTSGLLRRDLGADGGGYVLLSLGIAWVADTGGYFFGRFLGRTKLYPAISPQKTRAGFVGALAGAVLAALAAHYWFLPRLPLASAVVLGLVAGALGQLGDLAESLLKRSTGNKDSGRVLPGHGGLLDRIDALLIVSPIVYAYAIWIDRG
jgi:phosphatidate cytidylyltransferase